MNNQMTIAREEVFGPVLAILPYQTEIEAVEMWQHYGYRPMFHLPDLERAKGFTPCRQAWCISTTPASILMPLAATNNPVTAVNGGALRLKTFWKPSTDGIQSNLGVMSPVYGRQRAILLNPITSCQCQQGQQRISLQACHKQQKGEPHNRAASSRV